MTSTRILEALCCQCAFLWAEPCGRMREVWNHEADRSGQLSRSLWIFRGVSYLHCTESDKNRYRSFNDEEPSFAQLSDLIETGGGQSEQTSKTQDPSIHQDQTRRQLQSNHQTLLREDFLRREWMFVKPVLRGYTMKREGIGHLGSMDCPMVSKVWIGMG